MRATAPPLATQTSVASPSQSTPSTKPLMSNLSRLSQSTSRPNIPQQDQASYTARTMRLVSRGGKEVWRRSGLGVLWPAEEEETVPKAGPSSSPSKIIAKPTLNVSNILYPTMRTHPSPAPFPMLVLSLAQISSVSPMITNDELFDVLLRKLEPWVGEEGEGGYVLIILAADDRGTGDSIRQWPGLPWWIWRWRRIPRKYRKNLKRLYIIHPSLFTRTLLPLLLPLLSPKSYPKLHPLPSLLTLAHLHQISLAGMELTLPVLHEEASVLGERPDIAPHSRKRRRLSLTRSEPETSSTWSGTLSSTLSAASSYLPIPRFGSSDSSSSSIQSEEGQGYWRRTVQDIVQDEGGKVPRLLVDLREATLQESTQTEGIFRRTSNSALLAPLVSLLDLPVDEQPSLPWREIAHENPLLPPKVLLRFFGELTVPIIPPELYPLFRASSTIETRIRTELLPALDTSQILVLNYAMGLLHDLCQYEQSTKMSALAYAIVIAPTLISGSDPLEDAAMCLPPGKKLPKAMMGDRDEKGGSGTLVGVLEMWIREHQAVSEGGASKAGGKPRRGKELQDVFE